MENLLLATIFAIITAILWGSGPVFFKKTYDRFSSYFVYVVDGLIGGTIIFLPFVFISGELSLADLPESILYTFIYSVSYLFYLRVFEEGKASFVGVVTQIYPVFTILLALSIGNESLTVLQFFLIALILTLTVLLSAFDKRVTFKAILKSVKKRWFVFSLIVAILIGVGDFMLNESIELHNVYTATFSIYITQIVFSIILFLKDKSSFLSQFVKLKKNRSRLISMIIGSLSMTIGAVSFYKAFEYGPASFVSPVAATAPIFTIIVAIIFLKEKVSKSQIVLISAIIACVIALSL